VADPQSPRLGERPLEYHETATGNYYLPSDTPGDVIIQAITAGKVFEPHIVEAARQFIRPGTVALDVGACFGQMSILFSEFVGEDGEVMRSRRTTTSSASCRKTSKPTAGGTSAPSAARTGSTT
jgi:hypothetical protein